MSISSASELELSLIRFAGSDSTSTWQGGDIKEKEKKARGMGGGAIFQGWRLF